MHITITTHCVYYLLTVFFIIYSACAFAIPPTAGSISVSTPQGVPLDIDLSNAITGGDGVLSVSVPNPPDETQGVVSVAGELGLLFTPAVNFKGIVRFSYQVNDTLTPQLPASATITVTVAETGNEITAVIARKDTPSAALGGVLDISCPGLQDIDVNLLNDSERELLVRCNDLLAASAQGLTAEVIAALQQIAPEDIAAQIRAGRSLSERQMGNIGGRLSALRRGSAGVSLAGLSLRTQQGAPIPGTLLNEAFDTGGSAGESITSPWGMFVSGVFGRVKRDQTQQEDGFSLQTLGTTIGADYRFNGAFIAGGAMGFASSDVDINNNAGNMGVEGVNIAGYATYYISQKTYLDGILSYNRHRYDSTRNIRFVLNNNPVDAQAKSKPDGHLLALSIGAGHEFYVKKGWVASAKGRLDYASSSIGAYDETGAGGLNLSIEEQQSDSLVSSLGLQMSYAHSTRWGVLVPQFDMDWQHQFQGDAIRIKGQFINDQFGTTFQFKTDNPDRDYVGIGLGLSAVFPSGNMIFMQSATTLGRDRYEDYHLSVGARFEF
ncbi:MAG: autotransporter domain-containing protein [Gammaproteobacteria bacterium]|nr:autotransporter domain-containing protein [Gammaproteobacteria bacterium]